MQALEVPVNEAVAQAPEVAQQLAELAARHREQHGEVDACHTARHWVPEAGTYCYQTHIAISGQEPERLAWLASVFYRAASLRSQPWYPQFLSGAAAAVVTDPAPGIARHQLCVGRFDLGVGQPRYYRQLVSLAEPEARTRVIVARSVDEGPRIPQRGKLAYTLNPNGEVFFHADHQLHWHHICCTPGAALLPPTLDRVFINLLRRCKLDTAERATYSAEANQLRDWLQSASDTRRLEQELDFTNPEGPG